MTINVPATNYTLNASAKTITLTSPYDIITHEQILSIKDITTGDLIYDSENPTKHSIEVVNGVITYTYDSAGITSSPVSDKIQIVVMGSSLDSLSGSATNHVVLTADDTGIIAGGVAISTINTPLYVEKYSELHVFVGNTGQSTGVTITCRGSPTANASLWEDLAVITLGISPTNKAGTFIINFPSYVYFDIINNDGVNGAAIALTVQGK